MADPRARVRLSATRISPGEVIEVRALVTHPMETGNRTGPDGTTVPRNIVESFRATFDGAEVFAADLDTAVSANPYFQFHVAPPRSGTLTLTWRDDAGAEVQEDAAITVT
ncbi:thiosulfate oxidation carrier complex protein SoxZ [Rhodobaculum claviforme]|uniref:Thiosulfate oxidation carrier complex protein SoxZ n=1 Tax=Rhodobaculum claviforme TaxID=1549854 RepID=A0A934TLW5_9RHOB|nr:thiosulfate oxidation carrier complex protein SoxZ [Rhodobaculum claviforme]MBK5928534.1 thiosulfate oxidation carrier complex protein SoxZ [Rhodobaculum claviforme]